MGLWSKIIGSTPDKLEAEKPAMRTASWIPAERNPFGVRLLDLISITGEMISTSKSPEEAERASSWGHQPVAAQSLACEVERTLPCALRYPAAPDLTAGWLYVPPGMEQKWAIAYRDQAIYAIRSWSGIVDAIGRARRDVDELVVDQLELARGALAVFGEPVATFDWLIRAHALGQQVPLPVDDQGAATLERVPLSVFSQFGPVAAYAAQDWWNPPSPTRALRATSDVVTSVRHDQLAHLRAAAAAGVPLDARSPIGGYTALHIAVIKGSVPLVGALLELGADVNILADRDQSAVILGVVHGAPLEVLDRLVARGADPAIPNADRFGLIHAIAETDRAEYLPWALGRGLDLEARTRHGHTPLHIAAALGHVAALRALLDAGADRTATDPSGKTARDIANAENQPKAVAAL